MQTSTDNLRPFAFVLAVPDLGRSAMYFRDALGFKLLWPERSDWQLAARGEVRIMLGFCPNAMSAQETGDHSYFGYLHVDDVDAIHEEFLNRGALILDPPSTKPHGMREFVVSTPDGHRLVIGQILS